MSVIYDNEKFFDAYVEMPRSNEGLNAVGEWHRLQPLFPDLLLVKAVKNEIME